MTPGPCRPPLLTQAGFTVDSLLNATRKDMTAAIERFGNTAKRSDVKQIIFYYAGHGAQLEWRNYLLPVDAVVEQPEHMKQRCVDLGLLLGQLSGAKEKTHIVILDACRNNPFGAAYKPEQKGLSQFDAPVGSLLAYATSPGNVASDGEGANGLYTENLVRELSRRNTRLEDALKRVRLNVRLASQGAQVPWETTSLEGDVYLFNEDQKKLSEGELEKQAEADISEWTRIKSSKNLDDWTGYLRNFPNGRFAEIAQLRLARLLAEAEQLAAEERRRAEERQRARGTTATGNCELAEEQRARGTRTASRAAEEQRLAAERKQARGTPAQEEQRLAPDAQATRGAADCARPRRRLEREQAKNASAMQIALNAKRAGRRARSGRNSKRIACRATHAPNRNASLAEQQRKEEGASCRKRSAWPAGRPQPRAGTDAAPRRNNCCHRGHPSPAGQADGRAHGGPPPVDRDPRPVSPVPVLIPPSANPYSAGRLSARPACSRWATPQPWQASRTS
jgi:uncharacterized caspase-like protein